MPVLVLPLGPDRLEELQQLCYGLGWKPHEWYQSTVFDAVCVEIGYQRVRKDRLVEGSIHAHWIISHIRPAVYAKSFRPPKPRDLYNPDFEKRAKSEEVQEDRRRTLDQFPKTITPP